MPATGKRSVTHRGLEAVRAPRLLVHDGHLFDAMDHRQVAWPLNIRARLAEEYGFQYIVAMNLDFLALLTVGSSDSASGSSAGCRSNRITQHLSGPEPRLGRDGQ